MISLAISLIASILFSAAKGAAPSGPSCHYYHNGNRENISHDSHKYSTISQSVNFIGRFADLDTIPRADWSGSGIHFFAILLSNSASIEISYEACSSGCEIYVDVALNCQSKSVELLSDIDNIVNISLSGDIGSTIEISVLKRSEDYEMAITQIRAVGADLSPKSSTPSCSASVADFIHNQGSSVSPLKIIFFGDSITAGK